MADRAAPKGMRKGLTRYGDEDFSLFLRKAFIKAMGFSDDALSRPIVGIADTGSDYNACHATVPKLVEAVKRGVMLAGGLPMAFPTISLHESFAHPTSMFLRNLMAMDTEEMVRAQPMDAVVLIGGCDKTIPAQLMAAASAGVPALVVPTGPMMTGHYRGERLGACTDCRRFWGMYRAGELDDAEIEGCERPAVSHCRNLHGDGNGEYHGVHDGGAGDDVAGAARPSRPSTPTGCATPSAAGAVRSRSRRRMFARSEF